MNDYWKKWFGWSWSRHDLWEQCPRSYYYLYIGKWEPGIDGKRCKMLSKLISLPMSVGKFIHDAIKQELYHHSLGRIMSLDGAKRFFERKMEDLKHDPKSLVEYHNNIEISEQEIEEEKNNGIKQIENFFKELWPHYKDLEYIQHEEFEDFPIEKYKVWVVIDFISKHGDTYIVTDWKTGKPEDIENLPQMKAYTLWVNAKYNVPYENIKTEVVFLQEPENPQNKTFKPEDIDQFKNEIISDCKTWDNVTSIEDFELKPEKIKCQYCAFLTICEDGQEIVEKSN